METPPKHKTIAPAEAERTVTSEDITSGSETGRTTYWLKLREDVTFLGFDCIVMHE